VNVLTGSIVIAGKLVADPVFSETAKGKSMARLLLETELVREVGRGEFRPETHLLPVVLFSWVADQARALRNGSAITVACRLNGTQYTPTSGEVKHGIQLIAEALLFPPARKE
jgi:single-stranded DNA-binding protein